MSDRLLNSIGSTASISVHVEARLRRLVEQVFLVALTRQAASLPHDLYERPRHTPGKKRGDGIARPRTRSELLNLAFQLSGNGQGSSNSSIGTVIPPIVTGILCPGNGRDRLVGMGIGAEVAVRFKTSVDGGRVSLAYDATSSAGSMGAAYAAASCRGLAGPDATNVVALVLAQANGFPLPDGNAWMAQMRMAKVIADSVEAVTLTELGFAGAQEPLDGVSAYPRVAFGVDSVLTQTEDFFQEWHSLDFLNSAIHEYEALTPVSGSQVGQLRAEAEQAVDMLCKGLEPEELLERMLSK